MTAQVHIILGRAQNVLLVPSDALRDETKRRKSMGFSVGEGK